MKRILLLLASMALATLPASVVALVAPQGKVRVDFPGINGKKVFVRDGARDSHIFMIKALKDWKRGVTAGLLDAPKITLEAEAESRLLLVPIYWTFLCSSKSEPA
ncbi:MAG TPA: hypothetical protein VF068_08100 [Rubrobacter sp.]